MVSILKVFQNLALIGISVLVALILGEALLRIVTGDDYLAIEPILESETLVYKPNQSVHFRMFGEIDTVININSRGFRDIEYKPSASDNTIVALGDSFTEGWGVDIDQTYVKQLQRKLIGASYKINHIYNAGHYGTNPKNYVTVYNKYFKNDISVSLVTLGLFLGNDIIEKNTPDYLAHKLGGGGKKIKLFLSQNSSLFNILRRQVRYSRKLESVFSFFGMTSPPVLPGDIYENQDKNRWPYTAKFIYEFYQSLLAQNKKFLLILIPVKEMIDNEAFMATLESANMSLDDIDLYGFRDYLFSYCMKNKIPVLDLTPQFQKNKKETDRDLYFRTDDHWNAEGHRLASEVIYQYIRRPPVFE